MVWITVLIQKCENRYFKNLLYNYHAIVLEDRKKGLKPNSRTVKPKYLSGQVQNKHQSIQ